MGLILNIETATERCSVCLAEKGKVVALAETNPPPMHASVLTGLIGQVLAGANTGLNDLDAVAISDGPGSYTGLRIGASTAKGICFALDKPLIAVDTLEGMARACMAQVKKKGYYIPMIDARRMEVYLAIYKFQEKNPIKKTAAKIIEKNCFDEFLQEGQNIFLCGNGAAKCMEILSSPHIQLVNIECSAKYLAPLSQKLFNLGQYSDLAYYTPSYLKSPKITISKKKL